MNLLEPMRDAVGNNDHVTFAKLARLAALDPLPAKFVGRDNFGSNSFTTRHEGSRPFKNIENVRIACVNLGHSRGFTAARVKFEIILLNQRHAPGKSSRHVVALDKYRGVPGVWVQKRGYCETCDREDCHDV